jgi:hypothetical protein
MSTSKTKKDWLGTTYEAFCQKGGERPEAFKTMSGVKIDPLYTPEDLNNNYNDEITITILKSIA